MDRHGGIVTSPGVLNAGRWLIVALPVVLLACCSRSRTYKNDDQEALYAAEAGIELGRMHLAEACKSAQGIADLRQRSTTGDMPLPGYEEPTNKVLGQTIRAKVSVRLRMVQQEPLVWLVVSTGEASGTRRVLEARLSCAQVVHAGAQ